MAPPGERLFDDDTDEDNDNDNDDVNGAAAASPYAASAPPLASEADAPLECAVCTEAIVRNDNVGALECGHRFHFMCLTRWAQTCARSNAATSCPACRRPVVDRFGGAPLCPNIAAIANDDDDVAAQKLGLERVASENGGGNGDGARSSPSQVAAEREHHGGAGASVDGENGNTDNNSNNDEWHQLVYDDISMDDLHTDNYAIDDVCALLLRWRDAMRMGLRADHLSSWIGYENVVRAFGATWRDLERDMGFTIDDVRHHGLSARTLRELGCTLDTLVASGLARTHVVEWPYTLTEWRELGITRRHVQRFALRRDDYAALVSRGWTSLALQRFFGYDDRDLGRIGMQLRLYDAIKVT